MPLNDLTNEELSWLDSRVAFWAPEEEALVVEHGPKMSSNALRARYLPHRSASAIRNKAQALGVLMGSESNLSGGGHDAFLKIPAHDPSVEVRLVVLGDQQIPEIDYELHRAVLDFLTNYLAYFVGPTYLVNLGDLFNATSLGKFDYPLQTPDMQAEINEAKRVLEDYSNAAQADKHIFIEGNHEWRLQKAIRRNPEMGVLIGPMADILDAENIGVDEVLPYVGGIVEFADTLLIEHGVRASKHSAYTAKLNVEDTGMNHIVGHTHRLGVHYKRYWEKTVVGLENGCLCVDQDYAHRANWHRGFTYFRFYGNKMWFQQVDARNSSFYAEGAFYGRH